MISGHTSTIFRSLVLFVLLQSINVCFCENVELTLKQGVLIGKVEATFGKHQKYFSFHGIPFAEPPVGNLRFMPPKPLNSWSGKYKAYDRKPTCMQGSGRQRNNEAPGISGSEDCLYLSIFTPALNNNLPVIVFDYNDNFQTGFNTTDAYLPDFFIEEDVIIVTINHRLSVFGYLNTEDDVIPGNAGLKDFILGLQWVQNNIKKFGGDPKTVTLMGNRGGAALAHMLLYSEKAKGLFNAVTIQSGTSLETLFFAENTRNNAFVLGEVFDIKTNNSAILLEKLQTIDASELIENEYKVTDTKSVDLFQKSVFPFVPVIEIPNEDAVLTSLPDNANIVNDVPVLIGFNSRDGLDLVSHYIFEPRLVDDTKSLPFLFPIRTNYRFDKESNVYWEALEEISKFYFKEGYFNVNNVLDYAIYIGDALEIYALDYAVKQLTESLKSSVYYYIFDFNGSLNENFIFMSRNTRFSLQQWGATITDELCYLHLCSRIKKNYIELIKLLSEQPEQKIAKKMVRMWANFARTGNPTPKEDAVLQGLVWNPVEKKMENYKYLHITKKIKMKSSPIKKRIQFWHEFLTKYAKQAKDGVVRDVKNKKEDL